MRFIYLVLTLSLLIISSCEKEPSIVTATGNIYNIDTGALLGTILASQHSDRVILTLSLVNDESYRIRAAHIHQGDCDAPGDHWNQGTTQNYCDVANLDGIWGRPYAGDVGNIEINSEGLGSITVASELWTLSKGKDSDINGRSVVIHLLEANFMLECDPNHNPDHTHTNPKIGCGMINLDKP